MEYLRKVDFTKLSASPTRSSQMLLERASGATTCKIMVSRLLPGDSSPRGTHTHTFDQIFYILTGTLGVEIDGVEHFAEPGTLVINPAGVAHRNFNPADATAETTFLEFMAPLPEVGATRDSPASYVDPKTKQWVTPDRR